MKITYISKDTSLMLRGFALLCMVVLHLYVEENMGDAFSLCSIQGVPLASWLIRACNPVGCYLFISGYGLYFTSKARPNMGGQIKRIVKLYKLYWLSLLVFVPLACWLRPESYPGSWTVSLESITAFRTYWNGEIWFLFPYVVLVLTSKWLFRLLDRVGCLRMMAVSYVLTFAAMFLVSRYYTAFFRDHYAIYQVVLYFDCLFMFVMGAVFCKCADREFHGPVARLLAQPQWVLLALFALVFLSICIVDFSPYGQLCSLVMISLFVRIEWLGIIKRGWRLLGRYSTVVWFVHTWICYYCFKDYIYALHYPLLMLAATLAGSMAVGYVILRIDRWSNRLLHLC